MTTQLFDRLRALCLPPGEFVIFGSGPLVVRGLVAGGDLDVLCRGAAWEAVQTYAAPRPSPWGVDLVSLDGGRLTFGTRWAIGEVDVDRLIDTAEMIDGLPFARVEHVLAYKRLAGRAKDLEHLAAWEAAWEAARERSSRPAEDRS